MLLLFNKPFQVVSQFSPPSEPGGDKLTLKDYIDIPNVYPAGRLDYDSEGLLLLTDDGRLQARIADPRYGKEKEYWVQVEGRPTEADLDKLRAGVTLKDGPTRPAQVEIMEEPALWPRNPPIRFRKDIPTTWLRLVIGEGRNRQVRRMTAHIGFPTLRLVRWRIGEWTVEGIESGTYRMIDTPSPGPARDSARYARKPRRGIT
ncbi:MAG: pseudouridine synthase [Gammaproteobacteria bacterium]|nr:pseudouridine synthase [Gammaproteobacteria bacterium]